MTESLTLVRALVADDGGMTTAYQPIVDLSTGRPVAYEALARFGSGQSPATVFERARAIGVGHELEALALDCALAAGPPPDGARLSLNLSPSTLCSPDVLGHLPHDLSWIMVEVTENELVTHDDAILDRLSLLRERGARIAVDDAGAGYASLKQVMHLRPDSIKLDRSLISGVHEDAAKRALIEAFVDFGRRIGATVCAEGIEHPAELTALADLDVATGQGYLFAVPGAPYPAVEPTAAAACVAALRDALRGRARAEHHAEVTLESVGRHLAACRTLDDLDRCLGDMQRLLDVPEMAVSRLVETPEGPALLPCASTSCDSLDLRRLDDYPVSREAVSSGDTVQVLAGDVTADPAARDVLLLHGYGALLVVPLVLAGRAVGTLAAYSREEQPWTRRQITMARAVGHQLALALPHLAAPRVVSAIRDAA